MPENGVCPGAPCARQEGGSPLQPERTDEERERAALAEKRRGHRMRRRRKVLEHGAFGLTDSELLEMLLYYVMPRVDTAETAKALLARFGSIKGILDSDGEDIKKVRGLKENAEVFFMLLRQVSLRDIGAKGVGDFRRPETAAEYLFRLYAGIRKETVCAICLDEDGGMLDSSFVYRGDVNSARFSLRAVTEGVLRNRGRGVIIAHNHPSGSVIPSGDDINTTQRIAAHLAANDITLVEHYVIGFGECCGILSTKIYKSPGSGGTR